MGDSRRLFEQIASAAAHVDPGLSDPDIDRLVAGARAGRRRRVVRRIAVAALLVGAGSLALLRASAPGGSSPNAVVERAQENPGLLPLHLHDGSMVTALDPASVIAVQEDSPSRIALALDRGRARFDVAAHPERDFVVQMGEVTVTVVGTAFTVERVADRVGVSVERGTVRVDWQVGKEILHGGDSGWFPPVQIRTPPEPPAARSVRPRRAHVAAHEDTHENNAVVAEVPPTPSAADLLAAADAARSAGRSAESAQHLERLLREHKGDPRAPLAAFTLGRIFLMELAQPRAAARSFSEVRALAPGGPFAEDALAREAEAWNKAGDSGRAGARAREYLRLYPHGRRAGALKGLAGIE
jgi:transmembrane sensor